MTDEENILFENIRKFSEENIIVVEGKKDVAALKAHNIPSISLNGSIDLFAERHSGKKCKVLILTDFDEEGKKLRLKLKEAFSRYGIEENEKLRKEFKRITRLSHIEGLNVND